MISRSGSSGDKATKLPKENRLLNDTVIEIAGAFREEHRKFEFSLGS